MSEQIDIFFNSVIVGTLDLNENVTQAEVSKKAQIFLPKRTMNIKEVFIPHKSISLFEKK